MTPRTLALLPLLLLLLGCPRGEDDQRTEAMDPQTIEQARERLDPAALAHIDSGNVAFREQRFEEARRLYEEAARRDADAAAAWFGIYMAETAMGNHTAAEQAIRRARAAAPRASLVEETLPPESLHAAPAAGAPADTGRRP